MTYLTLLLALLLCAPLATAQPTGHGCAEIDPVEPEQGCPGYFGGVWSRHNSDFGSGLLENDLVRLNLDIEGFTGLQHPVISGFRFVGTYDPALLECDAVTEQPWFSFINFDHDTGMSCADGVWWADYGDDDGSVTQLILGNEAELWLDFRVIHIGTEASTSIVTETVQWKFVGLGLDPVTFQIDEIATVTVPEPGAEALLAGVLLLAWGFERRARRDG